MDLQDYERARRLVEKLRSERDKALGERDAVLRRLREKHGAASTDEARRMIDDLAGKLDGMRRELDAELEDFEIKWGAKL